MRQKSNSTAASSETLVRNIRRKHHAAEEKIRIVLDGLRGETSIAELCRREGIAESMCITLGRRINGRRSFCGTSRIVFAARSSLVDPDMRSPLDVVISQDSSINEVFSAGEVRGDQLLI